LNDPRDSLFRRRVNRAPRRRASSGDSVGVFRKEEGENDFHEDDLSAEEAAEKEGARLPEKDENQERTKGIEAPQEQRKKVALRVTAEDFSFGKMRRPDIIRDKRDFSRLYKRGRSAGGKYLVLFCIKNGLEYSRHAFLASKKVGNSVKRNRARRLLRESYRHLESRIGKGYDILFIARNTIEGAKCGEVEQSMIATLKKNGLLI
jgi:ribonuclease P protein component